MYNSRLISLLCALGVAFQTEAQVTTLPNGNVGVGTTTPQAAFQIGLKQNAASLPVYNLNATNLTDANYQGLLFNSYNSSADGYKRFSDIAALGYQNGTYGGSALRFLTNNLLENTAQERMRIERNGNVGIGTAAPTQRLHLVSNVSNDGIKVEQTGTSNAALYLHNSTTNGRNWGLLSSNAGHFSISDMTSAKNRFSINGTTGNVDINTDALTAGLHVTGTNNPDINLSNGSSNLEIGVATCAGCFSTQAAIGDATIKMGGMSRVFFGTNVSGGVGGERSFVFVDNDRVNMSIWNRGRVAIGNMTYAQTNANYALFTEKGILTERIKLAAQTSPDWASAPTAILHTVGTVRFQNLPSGTGKALVVDANGNVFVSNTLAGIAPNNGSQPIIEAQAKEINDLKARLERLEAFLSNQMVKASDENIVLEQNRPNPANGSTTIGYELPNHFTQIQLNITDVTGKVIHSQPLAEAKGAVEINTTNWNEGIYMYTLVADGKVLKTKKMLIAKN